MSFSHLFLSFLMLTILQISSPAEPYIHRVTLTGSPGQAIDRQLRKACASIEEGKVYNRKALDKAIAAINKLGLFRKVTRDDCSVTPSNIAGMVDITIRVKLKDRSGGKPSKPN